MGRWYRTRYYWVPREQTVRRSDGRKVVTRRFGPRDWTRTTTHPGGRQSTVSATSDGPMSKVVGVAMLLVAPAAFLGLFSIPIYVVASVLMVLWLTRRTLGPKSTVPSTTPPKPAPAN